MNTEMQQKAVQRVLEEMYSYNIGSNVLQDLFNSPVEDSSCSSCHFSRVDNYEPCIMCPNDRYERLSKHTGFDKIVFSGGSLFKMNGELEVVK